jgi:ABC-2 type transport system permease protein
MEKYLSVFKISYKQEFIYKWNFIMWRVRNILQIFFLFFLWDAVFGISGKVIFGYTKAQILTYVFGIAIVKAFVMSSRTIDVAGEISRGELSNYLVKPVNYFKYWFTRDLSSKLLNLLFAVFEISILFLLLRPEFYFQTNLFYVVLFFITVVLAIALFSLILFIVSSVTFWLPEMGWGAHFLITVVATEFLSGSIFPLNILPESFQTVLYLTPFPYLIFFPLQIYLGALPNPEIIKGIAVSFLWFLTLTVFMKKIWNKGLMTYEAYGK